MPAYLVSALFKQSTLRFVTYPAFRDVHVLQDNKFPPVCLHGIRGVRIVKLDLETNVYFYVCTTRSWKMAVHMQGVWGMGLVAVEHLRGSSNCSSPSLLHSTILCSLSTMAANGSLRDGT